MKLWCYWVKKIAIPYYYYYTFLKVLTNIHIFGYNDRQSFVSFSSLFMFNFWYQLVDGRWWLNFYRDRVFLCFIFCLLFFCFLNHDDMWTSRCSLNIYWFPTNRPFLWRCSTGPRTYPPQNHVNVCRCTVGRTFWTCSYQAVKNRRALSFIILIAKQNTLMKFSTK